MPDGMSRNAVIDGTFSDFKLIKSRSVCQMVIEIPLERAQMALEMFGVPQPGHEVWVAVARLQPPAPAAAPARSPDPSKSERAKESYALKTEREKAVVRASLLCKDPQFQKWMCNNTSYAEAPTESITTFLLHDHLGIKSRSEIGYDERAYKAFCDLEYQFDVFTGKKAGPR